MKRIEKTEQKTQMPRRFFQGLTLLTLFTAAVGLSAQERRFEFKMISSGPNRPQISLGSSPFLEILVGLHAGTSPPLLAASLGLSEVALAAKLDSLRNEGAVTKSGDSLYPTCLVVTPPEGAALTALASQAAEEALSFMRPAVQDVRVRFREIAGLRDFEFDDASFFLISDVLLDNWQINEVERRWLGAERPERGRARYYCAILARTRQDREAFGVYGNQVSGLGGGRYVGVYGNRRGVGRDLLSLSQARLAQLAAMPETTNRAVLLSRVVDDLERWARHAPDFEPPPALFAGLSELGLIRQRRPLFAVLDTADQRRLGALAGTLTDSLVTHLGRWTPRLRDAWRASRWHAETTFEEFRIWWYHFFYTELTNQLAAEDAIDLPETGLFHYLMIR